MIQDMIARPAAGERTTVYAQPGEKVSFGFDLRTAKIDVLGSDLIITTADGGQVILSNMAVLLFSENPPELLVDGKLINPDDILSSLGVVQNVSGKDATTLATTIQEQKSSEQSGEKAEKPIKIVENIIENAVEKSLGAPSSQTESNTGGASAQGSKSLQQVAKKLEAAMATRKSDFDKPSKPDAPPVSFNPPKAEAQYNPDLSPRKFTTEVKLLQPGPQSSSDGLHLNYKGGGGSEAAILDPNPLTQIQAEFIDVSFHDAAVTVFADNPDYVADTLLTRIMEYKPALPSESILTEIIITGLPLNISIAGLERSEDGSYVVKGSDLNTAAGGSQNFIMQYDPSQFTGEKRDIDDDGLANEYQSFILQIQSFADYKGKKLEGDVQTIPVIVKDTTLEGVNN
jgi:hypothetical protein